MTRSARLVAGLASAATAAVLFAVPAPSAQAAGPVERVCVVNRADGVITHRYVLVYRMTAEGRQTDTRRMPRRDHRALWSRLCGPNGSISNPS